MLRRRARLAPLDCRGRPRLLLFHSSAHLESALLRYELRGVGSVVHRVRGALVLLIALGIVVRRHVILLLGTLILHGLRDVLVLQLG